MFDGVFATKYNDFDAVSEGLLFSSSSLPLFLLLTLSSPHPFL
jgi:hypothetical protein